MKRLARVGAVLIFVTSKEIVDDSAEEWLPADHKDLYREKAIYPEGISAIASRKEACP